MRITVVSEITANEYDENPVTGAFASEYLAGCHQPGVVPGVVGWDNITATMPDPATIVLSADITTEDVVGQGHGDYEGQEVSQDWIRGYITGADVYWLIPGALRATEITFA